MRTIPTGKLEKPPVLFLALFFFFVCFFKNHFWPWLVWCSGLDIRLKQRVASSIPSQGTCLGCRPGPQLGAHKRQPHIDISLPVFLISPLRINKWNLKKYIFKNKKNCVTFCESCRILRWGSFQNGRELCPFMHNNHLIKCLALLLLRQTLRFQVSSAKAKASCIWESTFAPQSVHICRCGAPWLRNGSVSNRGGLLIQCPGHDL